VSWFYDGIECLYVEETVSRLTMTLDDSLHQALKEAAARQGRSIGKLIDEGLLLRGI
jgi:predicted HicB family RNase H-like nuclease